jgi:hypothetical protein
MVPAELVSADPHARSVWLDAWVKTPAPIGLVGRGVWGVSARPPPLRHVSIRKSGCPFLFTSVNATTEMRRYVSVPNRYRCGKCGSHTDTTTRYSPVLAIHMAMHP